jgi:hypothetical protein
MSTLANITSLNLSLQTGGAALAVKSAGRLVAPARTVFVYGTADDVAPNFTTVAGAITYANSLTPLAEEPVVIRLFTKTDGAPYTFADIAEPLDWDEYANAGLFFVSDYVRLNKTTSIPSSLPAGQQVWYIDPNGVETLWVGREDGSAQLVGGELVGDFTPIFFTTDTGTIVTTPNTQKLVCRKVGNLVSITGSIGVAITGSPFEFFGINNLPYPAKQGQNFMCSFVLGDSETWQGLTDSQRLAWVSDTTINMGDATIISGSTTITLNVNYVAE